MRMIGVGLGQKLLALFVNVINGWPLKENPLVLFSQTYLRLLICFLLGLSLAKLHAYRFSFSALKVIRSYLANRKQNTNVFNFQFLGRRPFWGTTRIYSRTFV